MNIKKYILSCKLAGFIYSVPFILMLFVVFYCYMMRENPQINNIVSSTFENIIPIFASWWVIYALYELLEEEGGEVLFTYGINKTKLGLGNCLKNLILYIVIWIPVMALTMQITLLEINYELIVQVVFQSIFFGGFSFCTMALLKDIGWSFFIQFGYFSAAYFTEGNALGELNIFLFHISEKSIQIIMINGMKCFIYSCIFMVIGNYFINKDLLSVIKERQKK